MALGLFPGVMADLLGGGTRTGLASRRRPLPIVRLLAGLGFLEPERVCCLVWDRADLVNWADGLENRLRML